jgi:hypothetical protein
VARVGIGNHFNGCRVRWGAHAAAPDLALLHFHHTGERRRVERSWQLILAREIVDRNDSAEEALQKLRSYKGLSHHAAAHLAAHLEMKIAAGASATDAEVFALRDVRTHGLERSSTFEVVEWRHASSLLG